MFDQPLKIVSDSHPGVEGEPPTVLKVDVPPYYLDPIAKPHGSPDITGLFKTSPLSCTPRYAVLECGCGRRVVPQSCHRLDCLTCAKDIGLRRSNSLFNRITTHPTPIQHQYKHYRSQVVIYTVFTVPESIRDKFKEPRYWQRARKEIWRCLRADYGGLYGVEVSHPIGDEAPTKFHPHLNFLWVQRDGYRPYIDVTGLRMRWAQILGVQSADVHSQYSDSHYLIRHWTNYVTRTFPGYHWWTGPVRWYGHYPIMKRVISLCPDCGCRIMIIGYLLEEDVQSYYERGYLMGRDPPWYDDSLIMRVNRRKGVITDANRGDGYEEGDVGLSELSLHQGRNIEDD
jgi:hypothetical protein